MGATTWSCLLALSLLTLGEIRLVDRLLFSQPAESEFVLRNIAGVLAGTPMWKAFQSRLLGPAMVAALDAVTGDRVRSLRLFGQLALAASNLLLFCLVRRRGGRSVTALLAVVCFGLVRVLLTFKLEYPWDGLDVLLFLAFGHWASIDGSLVRFSPLLLVAAFNHETALYIPLWYLLVPLDGPERATRGSRESLIAVASMAVVAAFIVGLRNHLYVGRPAAPGQAFEPATPLIGNPMHLAHNLRQFFLEDWKAVTRVFISATLLAALGALVLNVKRKVRVRASVWSLCAIACIFLFGYVNETRLYLPVVAFWFSHAWPVAPRSHQPRPSS